MIFRDLCAYVDGAMREGVCVRVERGRIVELGEHLTGEGVDVTRAGAGAPRYLVPGYMDIHIHGYAGQDVMGGEEAVRHLARNLPRHGVTSFLPTTMSATVEQTHHAMEGVMRAMQAPAHGATVLGCHMEGPFINVKRRGAQPTEGIQPPTMDAYRQMTRGCEPCVRLMTLAPEIEGARQVVEALRDHIVLALGHTTATAAQTRAAADWGMSQVTHLFNCTSALEHREPGVPGVTLTDARIGAQLVADLHHLDGTTLLLCYKAKGAEGCILITDAMMATGMGDGTYTLGASTVIVQGGVARLPEGNLAGSTLTMDQAVRNMVRRVGVPLTDALRMASRTPAEQIGERLRGRIAPGCYADFAVLDAELGVVGTWAQGERVY